MISVTLFEGCACLTQNPRPTAHRANQACFRRFLVGLAAIFHRELSDARLINRAIFELVPGGSLPDTFIPRREIVDGSQTGAAAGNYGKI